MSRLQQMYTRFALSERIEHIVLLASFTTLVFTGLPQKYADTWWGASAISLFGGIEMTRQVHHVAAIILLVGAIYHGAAVTYKVFVKRVRLTMMPGSQDMRDALQALAYNLHLSDRPPVMHRYTFGEKIEYWAVVWGTVVMALTGFMLWNPIATTQWLPGQFIPAAKAAHGGEAILAAFSILTWHMYHVHVRVFNRSMFTGQITQHEMEHEHPLELAERQAGVTYQPPPPDVLRRRQRVFFPVAAVIMLAFSAVLFYFVTFEETAITTVPRQDVEIFVPVTPTAETGP